MSPTVRARLEWHHFYAHVDLPKGELPPSIVLPLETIMGEPQVDEAGFIIEVDREAEPLLAPDEGWEFRLQPTCDCTLRYVAVEPPWQAQIRNAIRRNGYRAKEAPCPP